ncbi:MAG: hypothetical protein ACKO7A_18230, partial [Microcystis sp.]
MYVFQHTGQLSIEEFHSPFGGKLDSNNRWVLLHKVIPWMSLESHYAPQFTAKTGAELRFSEPVHRQGLICRGSWIACRKDCLSLLE